LSPSLEDPHLETLAERGEGAVDLIDVRAMIDVEKARHHVLVRAEAVGEFGGGG
jgi:hypothetical protein